MYNQNKVKILNEGQPCRKCDTPVVKKYPKKKKLKEGQNHYYSSYYLYCPNCHTGYFIDSHKRPASEFVPPEIEQKINPKQKSFAF